MTKTSLMTALATLMTTATLAGCGGGGEDASTGEQALVTGDVYAGKRIYDYRCATCHRCGVYDTRGSSPDLAGKGALVLTKLGSGHGSVWSSTDITNVAAYVDSIAPLPVLTVTPAGTVTVPPGTSTRLDASVASSPVTAWAWTVSGSSTVVARTSYYVYTPTRTGTFYVRVTATVSGGRTLSQTVTFAVSTSAPPPTDSTTTTTAVTVSNCSTCHTGLQTLAPPAFHHAMLEPTSVNPPYDAALSCGTTQCHPADPANPGNTLVIRDCTFCHTGSHHGPAPMRYGTTVSGWQQTCAQCHGNEAYHQSRYVCTQCHGNVHRIESDHFDPRNCTVCHSTANIPVDLQTRCTTCHATGGVGGDGDAWHDGDRYDGYNDFAAPVVTSIACPPTLARYATGSFSATAADADVGDVLSYAWSFYNPTGSRVGERSGANVTYAFSYPGTNVARVLVTDRARKTAIAKCYVSVY